MSTLQYIKLCLTRCKLRHQLNESFVVSPSIKQTVLICYFVFRMFFNLNSRKELLRINKAKQWFFIQYQRIHSNVKVKNTSPLNFLATSKICVKENQ